MRTLAIALILGCGEAALAQQSTPAPPPPGMPDPGKLFQLPPGWGNAKPRFKLQIPDAEHLPSPPGQTILQLPDNQPKMEIDPGILHRPGGFARQPFHAAPFPRLYPDLKFLPVQEIAQLDPDPTPLPRAETHPIPRTWPNKMVRPISSKWENFRLIPVSGGDKMK